jgi:hypothetical protein
MKGLRLITGLGFILAAAAAAAGPEWYTATVDDDGWVGMMCNIALDAADRPHVVYCDRGREGHEARGVKYAYFDGAGWRITKVETGDLGQYCDIAIDSEGHPHISYNRLFDWITCRGQLKYAYYDGSRWHTEVVDDSGYAGLHTSIALDSRDRPHIAHRENLADFNGSLKHSYYDGSSWHTEIVETGADLGYHTSIAIDSHDNPHISYHYDNHDTRDCRLKYARYDGSSWHVETVDNSRYTGKNTSLALDDADRPHISYQEDVTRCLKYAYFNGSQWQITVVDADDVGHRTSIALDGAGRPYISYCQEVSGGPPPPGPDYLKYAYYDGAQWHTTYVEKGEGHDMVGLYNSLALDSYGDPHIVYAYFPDDQSGEYLKYACQVRNYLNCFTAVPRGYDGLALTWSVKSPLGEQIDGFNLYRREKGEEEWSPVNEAPLPGGGSGSYDDAGLACLRCYEYSLEGIIEGGKRPLGATEGTTAAPRAHVLFDPRPNPSSTSAVIAFELMDRADVDLSVYDLSGRKVATLAAGWLPPGAHECACDVSALAPGVYVYRMTAGDWTGARKMVVVR